MQQTEKYAVFPYEYSGLTGRYSFFILSNRWFHAFKPPKTCRHSGKRCRRTAGNILTFSRKLLIRCPEGGISCWLVCIEMLKKQGNTLLANDVNEKSVCRIWLACILGVIFLFSPVRICKVSETDVLFFLPVSPGQGFGGSEAGRKKDKCRKGRRLACWDILVPCRGEHIQGMWILLKFKLAFRSVIFCPIFASYKNKCLNLQPL